MASKHILDSIGAQTRAKGEEEKILEAIENRLGEQSLSKATRLGFGNFADVFWLNDKRKVLKLTKDRDDADASYIVQHKPTPYIVKTYDVFKVINRGRWTMYGIVAEKLTPLSSSTKRTFAHLKDFLDSWFGSTFPTLAQIEHEEENSPEKWRQWREQLHMTDQYLNLFKNWAKALDARHIQWGDYHPGNIMMIRRQPVISDLGFSDVPPQSIPELPVEDM